MFDTVSSLVDIFPNIISKHLHDGLLVHYAVTLFPAVVVRHESDGGVGDARLLGQHHLGHGGHVDHVTAPATEHHALRLAGEPRTLDSDGSSSLLMLVAQLPTF